MRTGTRSPAHQWFIESLEDVVARMAARRPEEDSWWTGLARRLAIDTTDTYYRAIMSRALDAGRALRLDSSAFAGGPVVLACGSLGPGGSERQVVTTANALAERMPDLGVRIVCMFLSPPPQDFYRPLVRPGIAVSSLPALDATTPALAALAQGLPMELRDVARYVAFFHATKPSIVHAWLDEINVKAGLAALIAGVPRVVLSGRSVAPSNFRLFRPYMASGYRRLLADPRVTALNNSAAGVADYRIWLDQPEANIQVLQNGLELDAFRRVDVPAARARLRARLGIAPDAQVVGTISRLYEEKRPLLWIQAAAALAHVHASCQFVYVGDGILAGEAKALAGSLGIASRCHFVGYQADAAEWAAGFDVFLLTSRKEGLPNVLIEAQALGVPVVTTDAGGASETLVPGVTGWVVDSGEAIALAERLATVLDDDAWRARARTDAPAFVASRFSIDRMLAETLRVYGVQVPEGVPA